MERATINLRGERLYVYIHEGKLDSVCLPGDLMIITDKLTTAEKITALERAQFQLNLSKGK